VGGARHYLPLRVNHGGVMPIIFASSFLLFPQMILNWLDTQPKVVYANKSDTFTIRGKYQESSSQGLEWMIIQSYYNGRVLRLVGVSVYFYNNRDPGSIKDGVPTGSRSRGIA
jgi:preprotein translocase subunit SecY